MYEYMTVKETAEKWGPSVRRVQLLCVEGRIEGAIKHASVWEIPKDAEKRGGGQNTGPVIGEEMLHVFIGRKISGPIFNCNVQKNRPLLMYYKQHKGNNS